jgi:hypothetical protein
LNDAIHGQSRTQSNACALARKALALGKLAIPKLMSGLGTSVKKCPNLEMKQITKKTTSKLVSIQSLKTFT